MPNPVGRPTKYNDEIPELMLRYFNDEKDKGNMPTLAGCSVHLGVDRDTLKEWNKKHPIFSATYKECKQIQEEVLIQGGLTNKFHGSFAIFTAKNVLGWRDKQDITSGGEKVSFAITTFSDQDKEKFDEKDN